MMNRPTSRRIAWHEAGHAVAAWDHGFTVVLVSIKPETLPQGVSFGRSQHLPETDCAIRSERQRENIVAMAGWAAEMASGEAGDETYDSGDLSCVLSRVDPSRLEIELGLAESEAERIVSANKHRVRRLADELIKRGELSDADEILAIIEAPQL